MKKFNIVKMTVIINLFAIVYNITLCIYHLIKGNYALSLLFFWLAFLVFYIFYRNPLINLKIKMYLNKEKMNKYMHWKNYEIGFDGWGNNLKGQVPP